MDFFYLSDNRARTMCSQNSLTIVLPIYNEGPSIPGIIAKISSEILKFSPDFEIIAVNDGSTDDSGKILSQLSLRHHSLRFIETQKNKGYGWALRQGISAARKEWVLIFDCDGQFDISDFRGMWREKEGRDCVLGWRRQRRDTIYRRILGKSGNLLANAFICHSPFIRDINCGFKLFRTDYLKHLDLISTGGSINFEILYRLRGSKAALGQTPVSHFPRNSGRSTGGRLNTVAKIIEESFRIVYGRKKHLD